MKRYYQSKEHRWLLILSSVFRVDLICLDEERIIEEIEEILLKDILISLQFYKDGNFMKISRIIFKVALIT